MLVDKLDICHLVGKNGGIIAAMTKSSGAHIFIIDSNEHSRQCQWAPPGVPDDLRLIVR